MKKPLQLVQLFFALNLVNNAWSQTSQDNLPVTNGSVYSMVVDEVNKKLYIGGAFTMVGPSTGNGAAINKATGIVDNAYPKITGNIFTVVPDGSGGWYIGGNFSRVGTVQRANLARIKSDKTLDASWNPAPNGSIDVIVVSGSIVYVGGAFSSIGGQTRNSIAALDASTGNATSWNPDANLHVRDIALVGSTVYVGGGFTNIGGQTRNRIAALDVTTGNATAWNPNADNDIYKIGVSGSKVYVGGDFTSVGGQSRMKLAALDSSTGNATSWNPSPNSFVLTLAVSGSRVYVGGGFSLIGGQTRISAAAVDTGSGNALSWTPNPNSNCYAIVVADSSVYIGGDFTNIGGQPRGSLAAVDTVNGNARSWNPGVDKSVRAFAISGSTVYAGGLFSSVGAVTRNNIASVDIISGSVSNWNPNADNEVWSFVLSGSTLYAGGYFTTIGGQSRGYLAALDTVTGNATTWNPNADYYVYTVAVSGSTVYAGGDFSNIGGQARNRIGAVDATTGNATSWNPNADNFVRSISLSGSTVYVGGTFANIGGQARSRIAAIDATTGNATSWNPGADNAVWDIIASGSTIYAAGSFIQIGGQSRNYIGAVDATTGNATAWNPNANTSVIRMKLSGSILYAGGDFSLIDGQLRGGIAALDVATGKATSWNPSPTGGIRSIAESPAFDKIYIGGFFYAVKNESRPNLAGFSRATPVDFVPPAVPQNLVVTDTLDQSLKIKWRKNTESDFKYYYIYRATTPNPTTRVDTAKGGVADTSKTYTGLTNGTRYYFRVSSVDTAGNESGYSNEASAVPGNPNLPTAPLGLYAIAGNGNGQVTLTWLKNIEPNVQRYRILRGTTSPATTPVDSTSSGNDTSKTISGLTNGALYYFRVMGVGITGLEGAASIEDAAVPIKAPGRVAEFTSGSGNTNLQASNFVTASAKTVAAWIKPTGTAPSVANAYSGQAIAGDGTGGGSYFGIKRASISSVDRIWAYNWDGPEDRVGITYIVGQWIHVALVHNGTMLYIYKNGVVADSVASGATSVISGLFTVGPSYNGSMDELTTWNRALIPAEIQSLANATLTGLEQGLTGYWRFDEPSGTTAFDGSPKGRNITATNAAFSTNHRFMPAVPSNLTVTDSSSTKISIRWNRSADTDFLRYRIYRATAPNPTTKVDSTAGGNIADTSRQFTGLTNGVRYYLRVTAVDSAGYESDYSNEVSAAPNATLSAEDISGQIPKEYSLSQNYPNPFNPSTVIRYGLPTRSHVKLEVYNMLAQSVAVLADEEQDARFYEKAWQAPVSSGLYFYRLEAVSTEDPNKSFVQVRKMLLLK